MSEPRAAKVDVPLRRLRLSNPFVPRLRTVRPDDNDDAGVTHHHVVTFRAFLRAHARTLEVLARGEESGNLTVVRHLACPFVGAVPLTT